ncbi:hypothetical protein GCM10008904_31090 [Paraclostridium ghonii]|uniref:Uncharacterized protein n=1 Tax=Paraclostridium ghonii TaxID=29358 RepID=A0ABU0MX56_9FIRM|nr:hypothetical protein [Paeniclostridium ghonii]MDQ0555490.1 hypothetical protein [Paeniclostridium ghonii]
MESGFGDLVLFVLGLWLFMFTAFGFSFSKNKIIATLGFLTFSSISAFYCYQMAEIALYSNEMNLTAVIQIICFILVIISGGFWFMKRKKVARWIGIISILLTIHNALQI